MSQSYDQLAVCLKMVLRFMKKRNSSCALPFRESNRDNAISPYPDWQLPPACGEVPRDLQGSNP